MPYRHSTIVYGLPQDTYPQQAVNLYIDDLKSLIHLAYEPVGVKLIFTAEEYEACPVPELRGQLSYCMMVKCAAQGKASRSRLEHHECEGAATALALTKSTEKIENGSEYFSRNLYGSQTAARRLRGSVVSLHNELPRTYGVLIQPLRDFKQTPDVIICIVSPYQAMRIVQGYEFETGIKPTVDMGAVQGICSECTAVPYATGRMNISVLCPCSRKLCNWELSDMAVGIPFEQFIRIVSGVASTAGTVGK